MFKPAFSLRARLLPPAIRRLILALALLAPAAIPVGWMVVEFHAAEARTRLAADTGAQWAADRLGAVIGRFDAITARLRPGATAAENATLTARLLRLEPQLHPATSIAVINPQLRVVAASHPAAGDSFGGDASAWLRMVLEQPADRIQLRDFDTPLMAGLPAQVAMARRLDDAGGAAMGVALTLIDRAEMRALVYPGWLRRSGAVHLTDEATGRRIVAHEPPAPAEGAPRVGGPVQAMRRVVEAIWGEQRVLLRAPMEPGHLVWSVRVDPWDALASDEAGLIRRGLAAAALAVALAVLTFLGARQPAGAQARPAATPAGPGDFVAPAPANLPGTQRGGVAVEAFDDLLDAACVEPLHFRSLVREYGQQRAIELLQDFIAANDLRLPRLTELVAVRDWAALARACQELSILGRSFGAARFADSVDRLGDAERTEKTDTALVLARTEWGHAKRALLRLVALEAQNRGKPVEAA